MFNTSTFFGTDGVLTLSDADGIDAAVFTNYFGEGGVVGRLKNISLAVSVEIKAFHELGSRAPKELRAGNIHIGGTVERAFINGALLKLMLGQYGDDEETAGFKIPKFNMKISLDNMRPAGDEGNAMLTIYDVMFDTWQFNLPEDDFVLEKLSFKARRVKTEDTELSA
ncbi:MAG: hypothetical protein EHM89_08115 [Acidobacteria bacterium]|nr:MAG: hypothetical protein EHM89_08115 [Acidobacteriota bacterium]